MAHLVPNACTATPELLQASRYLNYVTKQHHYLLNTTSSFSPLYIIFDYSLFPSIEQCTAYTFNTPGFYIHGLVI